MTDTFKDIQAELVWARDHYYSFASAHEGWAILREEVDELWDEVKKKPSQRSIELMRKEAIQIAAMAIRFVEDVCNGTA